MKRTFALALLLVVTAVAWGQSAQSKSAGPGDQIVYWSGQGKWAEDPAAPGTASMNVSGDPSKGPSVMFVRFRPGASMGWHWHPAAEMYYGVSGTFEVQVLEPARAMKITTGAFLRIPAHTVHRGTCVSKEPCFFYLQELTRNIRHMTDDKGNELNVPASPKN